MTNLLSHVKLKNKEDLLAFVTEGPTDRLLTITAPLSISVDMEKGLFAQSWLMLSENNYVHLDKSNIMLIQPASQKAVDYYEEFQNRLSSKDDIEEDESELESLFEDMLESKYATKH